MKIFYAMLWAASWFVRVEYVNQILFVYVYNMFLFVLFVMLLMLLLVCRFVLSQWLLWLSQPHRTNPSPLSDKSPKAPTQMDPTNSGADCCKRHTRTWTLGTY